MSKTHFSLASDGKPSEAPSLRGAKDGEGGIRTHGARESSLVFKTSAIDQLCHLSKNKFCQRQNLFLDLEFLSRGSKKYTNIKY